MLNELEEFRAYTVPPVYAAKGKRDNSYLGRFTYDILLEFHGLGRILTILARGYMWQTEEPDVDLAKRALCAWCSLPQKKKASPREDWQYQTCFPELHEAFPELVDGKGRGWLFRHVKGICAFVKAHPDLISSPAYKNYVLLETGFEKAWRDKLTQLQVPLFHRDTKGGWVLRFDNVLADAKERGPLRKYDIPLSADMLSCLQELTPKGVPETVLPTLVQYYLAHMQESSEWVVLPVVNFDAYFGSTSFSRRWLNELPEDVILRDRKRQDPCRYSVQAPFLNLPLQEI